jgi:uncharacterized protein
MADLDERKPGELPAGAASPDEGAAAAHLTTFGLERLGLAALGHRALAALLVMALTAAAVMGFLRLRIDDSLSELFRTDTREFHQFELIDKRFPSSEYDVLVVVEDKDLLERKGLEAFANAVIDLQLTEDIKGLVSMLSARTKPDSDGYAAPIVPDPMPEDPAAFADMVDKLRSNEIVSGKFLSKDGTLALVVIALDRKAVAEHGAKDVIGTIQQTVDKAIAGSGLTAKLTGVPVMQLEIRNAYEHDQLTYNGLGLLFGAAVAAFFFRRVSLMLVAALPPVLAVSWSLGLLGWLGFKLNLFLDVLTPLVMVMGFADSMQMTAAIRDRLRHGDTKWEAVRFTVRVVGPACVIAHGTALVSFLALLISDSALIRTFGTAGALATLVSYVAVVAVLPLLALLFIRNEAKLARDRTPADSAMDGLGAFVGWVVDRVVRHPYAYTVAGFALFALCSYLHMSLEPRYRLADQVPDREQALAATGRLDQKLTGANPIHIMIEWDHGKGPAESRQESRAEVGQGKGSAEGPAEGGQGKGPAEGGQTNNGGHALYSDETLSVIAEAQNIVEKQAGLGNVWSLESLRRWLAEAGQDSIANVKHYVGILPEHLVRRFIAADEKSVLVSARLPDIDASQILPVVDKLDAALNVVRKAHPGYEIAVTGLPVIAARNSASMIQQLNASLPIEVAFVAVLVGFAFRSFVVGALSLLPALFPVVATGAVLSATGEGIEFASVVALVVIFGLGVDGLVHFMNRLRREERPGEDPALAIRRARILVGPAIILTTVVLAFGLGVTAFSGLPSLRLFGRVCAMTLFASLVADLVFLPATIVVWRRLFPGRV